MSFSERQRLEQAAKHESGHALLHVLHGNPVTAICIGDVRGNTRDQVCSSTGRGQSSGGYVIALGSAQEYDRCPEGFLNTLAGHAAEDSEEFPAAEPGRHSDFQTACAYLLGAHPPAVFRPPLWTSTAIDVPYQQLRRLFQEEPFSSAVGVLQAFALRHAPLVRGRLTKHILRKLTASDIQRVQLEEMRRLLAGIDTKEGIRHAEGIWFGIDRSVWSGRPASVNGLRRGRSQIALF